MTTLDPTTFSDGKIPGWTKFGGGFDLGKSQANVPNRFVVWDTSYINWFYTKTIWQTPISSRSNHFISASFNNGGGWMIYNAASDASTYDGIQVETDGTIYSIIETGGSVVAHVGALTSPWTLSVDCSDATHPVVKYNGTSIGAIDLTALGHVRSGSYVGLMLAAGVDAGTIQIEPGGVGPTAPGAPTAVTATAGDTQASLTWTAPSDGGSAITDYEVDWSSNAGSTWLGPVATGSTSTSYTKTGLTNGTAYVFRIRAINAIGTGSYSATSSSVTPVAVGAAGRMLEGSGTRILESSSARYLESVLAASVVYTDYFNRADGALGSPWVQITAESWSSATIVSGVVVPSTDNVNAAMYYNVDLGSDHWVEADITVQAGATASANTIGVSMRGSTSGEQYYVWFHRDISSLGLWRHQLGGTYTQMGSYAAVTGLSGRIRIEAQGSALRVYWNNVLVINTTDTVLTGTRAGLLGLWQSATGTKPTLDNFRCGALPYAPFPTFNGGVFNGSSSYLGMSLGTLTGFTFGSLIVVAKNVTPTGGAAYAPLQLRSTVPNNLFEPYLFDKAGTKVMAYGIDGVSDEIVVIPASSAWRLLVFAKATGNVPATFWVYDSGTSTWTVDNVNSSVNVADSTRTLGTFTIGAASGGTVEWWNGELAGIGLWKNVKLTDAQVKSFVVANTVSLKNILATTPTTMVTNIDTTCSDKAGTCSEISRTAVSAGTPSILVDDR